METSDINHWQELISAQDIQSRIDSMTPSIQAWIDGDKTPVVMAGVATGGVWFQQQLVERLSPETYRQGLVGTSSYGGGEVGGTVDLSFNRTGSVSGHRLLLVDDIADRRKTLEFLVKHFSAAQEAAEIKIAVLLNKPSRKEVEVPLDFVGFNVPNTFVAGCGLDGGEKFEFTRNYRNVRYKEGTLPATTEKFWLPENLPA